MILFLNTDKAVGGLIPYKELSSIPIYEIAFRNKALTKLNMLNKITDFLDIMSYEEDRFLLIINDLDDAFDNLNQMEDKNVIESHKKLFHIITEQLLNIGHRIIYFTPGTSPGNQDILELSNLDGFTILHDEVKLYNVIINEFR